jgi:hypothetical protein
MYIFTIKVVAHEKQAVLGLLLVHDDLQRCACCR